jgi:hypothetical protein
MRLGTLLFGGLITGTGDAPIDSMGSDSGVNIGSTMMKEAVRSR